MEFNWETTVFALIAFGILYWALNRYAFGPLFSIMEQRQQLIKDQIATSERNRQQAETLLSEQQASLQSAKKDALDIIEQARQNSSRQAEELVRQAREEAGRIQTDALKDIENEKNKAVAALRSQVSAMSVMIASKIIEKQVDEKSQEQLIETYLNDVGGKQ